MLLNQEETHVLSGGDSLESAGMTAMANSKMFSLLTSGLYSNKIGSVCRELISNMWDAHASCDRLDVPFEVAAPTFMSPQCSFRDYGLGMSHEFMMTSYTVLFLSEKEFTNNAIGCYGIGRFSALAMSDSYIVVSRHEGLKSTYNVYMDETKSPRLTLVNQEPCTDSGLEVIVPCKTEDISKWESEITTYIKYLEVPPVVNFEYTLPSPILEGDNWKLYSVDKGVYRGYGHSHLHVRQGITCYEIDVGQLDLGYDESRMLQNPVVVNLPIGSFQVTLSREDIEYDKRTKGTLARVFKETVLKVKKAILEDLDKGAAGPLERLKRFKDYTATLKLPSGLIFNHNGVAYRYRTGLYVHNGHIAPDKHFTKWDDDVTAHRYRYDLYTKPYKPVFRLACVDTYRANGYKSHSSIREDNSFQCKVDKTRFFYRTTNKWRARLHANMYKFDKEATHVVFVSAPDGLVGLPAAVKAFEDEWGVKVENFDVFGDDPVSILNTNRTYHKTPLFRLSIPGSGVATWFEEDPTNLLTSSDTKYYVNLSRFKSTLNTESDISKEDLGSLWKYLKEIEVVTTSDYLYGVPKGNAKLIDEFDKNWVELYSHLVTHKSALIARIRQWRARRKAAAASDSIRERGDLFKNAEVVKLGGELVLGASLYKDYLRLWTLVNASVDVNSAGMMPLLAHVLGYQTNYGVPTTPYLNVLKAKKEKVQKAINEAYKDPLIKCISSGYYTRIEDSVKNQALQDYYKMKKELKTLRERTQHV